MTDLLKREGVATNDRNGGEARIRKRLQSIRIEIRKRSEVEKNENSYGRENCDEEACARGKIIGFTGTAVQSPDEICLPREWGVLIKMTRTS